MILICLMNVVFPLSPVPEHKGRGDGGIGGKGGEKQTERRYLAPYACTLNDLALKCGLPGMNIASVFFPPTDTILDV